MSARAASHPSAFGGPPKCKTCGGATGKHGWVCAGGCGFSVCNACSEAEGDAFFAKVDLCGSCDRTLCTACFARASPADAAAIAAAAAEAMPGTHIVAGENASGRCCAECSIYRLSAADSEE